MNERKPPRSRGRPRPGGPAEKPAKRRARRASGETSIWLYGAHAVIEALANPRRRCRRLLLGPEAAQRHGRRIDALLAARRARDPAEALSLEAVARGDIARNLPEGAVHQGLALLARPLAQPELRDVLAGPETRGAAEGRAAEGRAVEGRAVVVVLDQVTDPQNVGAVLRSAAAFGARALITTRRHAPPESGSLAKAASGALEHVPYLQVGNLARALETLKTAGFWGLGLSGEAEQTLAEADPGGALALVLGAEDTGLRRLTREACDIMARLPTRPPIDALNVSNAAAAALYELLGRIRGTGGPNP
jgi:23S rRNA (guanosine2251-2'-O)-methyltransferase